MLLDAKRCNETLGLELAKSEVVNCLRKQRIDAEEGKSGGRDVIALIPRYRADFLHEVDLIEEVALGYGYNAFTPLKPRVFTRGAVNALTEQSDRARDALAGTGFVEFAGFVLTSEAKAARAESAERVIKIRNPVSDEYNALRASLLPGILEVLGENTHRTYPQRLFEVGETVERDAAADARTRTALKACAASAHADASFSEIATALSVLGKALDLNFFLEKTKASDRAAVKQFIEGRAARVLVGGKEVGVVGELHPRVLASYGLLVPASAFEVTLA
jgi:phenylalanyl-tRNA synthetase beta chain